MDPMENNGVTDGDNAGETHSLVAIGKHETDVFWLTVFFFI